MQHEKTGILSHITSRPRGRRPIPTWMIAAASVSVLGTVGAFAVAPARMPEPRHFETVIEPLAVAGELLQPSADESFLREERIRPSDTIGAVLDRLGIEDGAALGFLRTAPEMREAARQLRPGQSIAAYTTLEGKLVRAEFPLGTPGDRLIVAQQDGRFTARTETLPSTVTTTYRSGEIQTSLFAATDQADIPDAIAVQLAEIFSGEIDFHRDLRRGDRFYISYETVMANGRPVKSGRILAAEFVHNGRALRAVYFDQGNGSGAYYDAEGKSLRKAFLRSPLEFSRVTSGFTNSRFHPVLKRWRAHQGVDYGAPIGTRVRVTSDGIVDFVGKQGGYGNLVVVRHGGNRSTAYGHLSRFAPGLRKGARVSQGDIIGFVGKTGLASGPHLHYEFRVGGNPVDPLRIALPDAKPLDRQALANFKPQAEAALGSLALARQYIPTTSE